jgi:hypothetical protein
MPEASGSDNWNPCTLRRCVRISPNVSSNIGREACDCANA